ncbi:alpha/beta fold hydrolase [Oleomonas cavernae]|uniref:alpha/beta fold hydrolase n=1 Tax=Oleomonas cavernae TaxID=2320859 RepID=UPI001F2BBA6E|nr:alpha/beta fold hydrolase [Oleomonas cavernae]
MTDAPLMIEHLYTQYGVILRGLGDRGHFKVPYWGELLVRHGMVLGSPEVCSALMQAGQHILVFPGGAREVMRRKGEAYKLIWKQRTGFARLAIEHGYDIIPFGVVGPDESYRILFDANDMTRPGWRQGLLERSGLMKYTRGGDFLPPAVLGLGPTLIPRPQRYYFGFGPRIPTEAAKGRQDDKDTVWALREQVAAAVESQIERLKQYREQDRPAPGVRSGAGWRRFNNDKQEERAMTDQTPDVVSRHVTFGNRRIFVSEAGEGYPVVMLHGGGPGASGLSNYGRNIGPLSAHFRVIVPDMLGYGQSTKGVNRRDPFGDLADAMLALLDALKIEKAHFIGNSLGGACALRLGLDRPSRVSALVLMGPAASAPPAPCPPPG